MKLIKILKVFLIVQILMYAWGIQIIYSSTHDGVDSLAGLGALLPLGIFVLLSAIDFVLFIIYLVKVYKNKLPKDIILLLLVATNILLALSYNFFLDWALSGPN